MYLTREQKIMMIVNKWERRFNGLDEGMKEEDFKEYHKDLDDWGINNWEVMEMMQDYYLI